MDASWQMKWYSIRQHEAQPSGFKPDKTRAVSFLNGFKNIPGKACVNRAHNNSYYALLHKHTRHRILMRSVLSADKKMHTNKEEVYRYKVTARDVLSTI